MHLKLATSWEGVSGRKKRAVLVAQLGLSGPRLGLVLLRDAIAPLEMAQVGGLSERLLKVACQGHLCQKNSSIPNGNKNRQFIPFGMEECLELDELTETQLSQIQLQNQLTQLIQLTQIQNQLIQLTQLTQLRSQLTQLQTQLTQLQTQLTLLI
ncbi:hypothetical protein PCASD_21418 [Puccinia coronata f. sp. avenae]|uniref:Uncharacterized protein n=1 Tax=Puccinia coronata f. sp. avenae TaxID=200324 RepID=A0A2N5SGR4_9BASI|nr:hypothetical protein PCASD_21418 [Puccinia coronata f. sp. avenae]